MIGIAALFAANGMKLIDGDTIVKIETVHGSINLPKDNLSDALRLQEAVEDKCVGGKGMIAVPSIKKDKVLGDPKLKWVFKGLWDDREILDTLAVWGGDFQTHAEDHLNVDDEFVEVNLSATEFYYNVCLSTRDANAFKEKNPSFTMVVCEEACMKKPHKHAVCGRYRGSTVGEYRCAPPLYLHPVWGMIKSLDPQSVKQGSAEHGPLKNTRKSAAHFYKNRKNLDDKSAIDVIGRKPVRWEGAEKLAKFIANPASTWSQVLDVFSDPKTAKWASSSLIAKSKSHQKKLKLGWSLKFFREVVPLLKGDGSPLRTVLDTIWRLDEREDKLVACYFTRRLVEGNFGVRSCQRLEVDWVFKSDL